MADFSDYVPDWLASAYDRVKGSSAGAAEAAQDPAQRDFDRSAIDPEVLRRYDTEVVPRQRAIAIDKTSWDRDPIISPMPTPADVAADRAYRTGTTRPEDRNITTDDVYAFDRPESWERRFWERDLDTKSQPRRKLTQTEADYLQRNRMMSELMPGSSGRFRPDQTTLSNVNPNAAIQYSTKGMAAVEDKPNVWLDQNFKRDIMMHELNHFDEHEMRRDPDGIKIIARMYALKNKLPPGFADWSLGEMITRSRSQRAFGPDAERGVADQFNDEITKLNKNPEWVGMMRELDRISHRKAAERTIAKQGGVYRRGGSVQPRVKQLPPKQEMLKRRLRVLRSSPPP